jgi:hypothetical protein
MTTQILQRMSKYGPMLGDMVASAAGCFVFTRGFRLVRMGMDGPDTASSMRAEGKPPRPLAGIGASLFLLAFVTSEAVVAIGALRH